MAVRLNISHAKPQSLDKLTTNPATHYATRLGESPFEELTRLGVDNAAQLESRYLYTCPWTKNRFHNLVPCLLVVSKKFKTISNLLKGHNVLETAADFKQWYGYYSLKPSTIMQAWLGHGYNSAELPSDGEPAWIIVGIPLIGDHGHILCWERTWLGK